MVSHAQASQLRLTPSNRLILTPSPTSLTRGKTAIIPREMASPRIDSYRFGRMVVEGQVYTRDLILLPGRVIPNWWRQVGHELHPTDLSEVIKARPAVLVVGQGAFGKMHVSQATRQTLQTASIHLIALPTAKAVDEYNRLRETTVAAGAFHLTC